MVEFVEIDEQLAFRKQLESKVEGPVILINKFTINPEEVDHFLKAWTSDAELFKQKPGFISTQLHRGIEGSRMFINYAVWESVTKFKDALSKMDEQNGLLEYPADTIVSPHLFKKVAVSGICID